MRRTSMMSSAGAVLLLVAGFCPSAEAQRRVPVNVESTPSGAVVFLDSASGTPLGTTPLRSVRIARGSHTLIFRLASYEEGRLQVSVRRRRETFRIVLSALSTLVITGGNTGSISAAVRVDGQPVGNVPYRATVQPGRHLVQVGREGYVTFTQWVELAGGQVLTLPVMLERQAPDTGSLLVAGDVSGAPIYLDGTPRGSTPTLIEDVPVGEHRLEIRPDGLPVHTETVRVIAGQRLSVTLTLRPTAVTGGLRVLANVPGATILLDGEELGPAPVSRDAVPAGNHILEARAQGYQNASQQVTVVAGRQGVVSVELTRDTRTAGRIIVDSNVGGATVMIDGEDKGNPPVVVEAPPPGTHAVVVRAEGYEDFRTTCETAPAHNCELRAELRPQGTPVRVVANARHARLYVDGELMGPIPYEGTVPVGEHRLEVRAPGMETHVEQVNLLAASNTREFNIALSEEGSLTEEQREDQARERRRLREGATSHSGAPLPPDQAVLDMSVGWPYVAEFRLNVGILDWLEGGFAMRTLGRLTEFEGRVKIGTRPLRQLSVGVQARLGGGLGPSRDPSQGESEDPGAPRDLGTHSANDFFLLLEAVGTLHFSDSGAFNLWMGVDIYSDGYDWAGPNSDVVVRSDVPGYVDPQVAACTSDPPDPTCDKALRTVQTRDGRQNTVRLRLGGSLDLVINPHWNVWGMLEGILAGPSRDVLGDIFGFGNDDTELYLRLGLTHKF